MKNFWIWLLLGLGLMGVFGVIAIAIYFGPTINSLTSLGSDCEKTRAELRSQIQPDFIALHNAKIVADQPDPAIALVDGGDCFGDQASVSAQKGFTVDTNAALALNTLQSNLEAQGYIQSAPPVLTVDSCKYAHARVVYAKGSGSFVVKLDHMQEVNTPPCAANQNEVPLPSEELANHKFNLIMAFVERQQTQK